MDTETTAKEAPPKISVVIPVYNGEKTIQETIESVLNQTFSDFEIIVIDDGSQDSTLDILARIQDRRLRIFSYPNTGLSASRNRGIAQAKGEFVAFLDADDLWTSDKLEKQLQALEGKPEAVLAYSQTEFIDESGELLGHGLFPSLTGNVLNELLVSNFIGSGSNPLIRKSVFAEMDDFDETLPVAEDWDMYLRLATNYDFVAVPSPQILYRLTETSLSSNDLSHEVEILKILKRAFANAPDSTQFLKRQAYARLYLYLTVRALRGKPDRNKGLMAIKFFWLAVKNDLSILRQVNYLLILLFKTVTSIVLSPQQAEILRKKVKSLIKNNSKKAQNDN